MVTAKLIAGAIKNMQMPFERSHQPQHCFAECCLARSVRADHPDEFSGVDREGDIFQCNDTGKTKGGVVEANDWIRGCWHRHVGSFRRQPLGGFQRVGQLEHIITEHVEIGLGSRKTAG